MVRCSRVSQPTLWVMDTPRPSPLKTSCEASLCARPTSALRQDLETMEILCQRWWSHSMKAARAFESLLGGDLPVISHVDLIWIVLSQRDLGFYML